MNYQYKYRKYKYKLQKAGRRKTEDIYREKVNIYAERLTKETVSEKFVDELIEFFKWSKDNSYDPELMHLLEDGLAKKFISDVATEQINKNCFIPIAQKIKLLQDYDYLKWYS